MAIESIALIPSGYKATKVYSQLPVNGNGDFTFDRGIATSVQTRVNKDGLIEDVAQDVPRLDYLDGGCPSLLLEPASTNLIPYSEDFSNVAWAKLGSTITSNVVLSPDGSVNADKLVEDSSNAVHQIFDSAVVSGNDYSFSVFAKISERRYFSLSLSDNIRYVSQYTFDLQEGVLTDSYDYATATSDYKITDFGNGWYRFELSSNYAFSGNVYGRIFLENTPTPSNVPSNTYLGDGTSGIYIYGAQLEQKSYATSYIPTSGSTAPRAAETCNGAGTTAEINSQEGVLYAEIRALANEVTTRVIGISDGSINNRFILFYGISDNTINLQVRRLTINQTVTNITIPSVLDYSKLAVKYSENEVKFYVNGILVDFDTATMPIGLNELAFDDGAGGAPFHGRVKKLSVYDSALTDSQLEALTGFGSFAEMKSYLSYS